MAGDTSMELLFLDTFKHQSAELTNIDVVRFPCGVLVTEIRVIPPGIKAHSSLPDSRAFGETAPHAFQLDLFYNNLSKPNTPVFHRLGSLEYDENKSIVFRPSGKVNTDGLVLRGWYTCLTVAVYGTAERPHSHERDTHSPPPPPPPPPQQHPQKRPKWENEEQFNGSPPRPQPRGPRTPPGPPPPDDDDDDTLTAPGPAKEESVDGEGFLEAVSPEPGSVRADEPFSEPEPEEEEGPEAEEEEEEGSDEASEPDEEEEEDEEMEGEAEEEEEEMDEEGEGRELDE